MLKLFFTALMFYTRIPCPKNTPHSPDDLNKATVYFPVIGWMAGLLAGLVFYFSAQVFSTFSAALLSTIATVLLTGAFHEDGFADCCDGFGGGWTKEKILTIMKDSRIGVFGALGLALLLLLKLSLLDDLFFLNGYLRGELWVVVLIFVSAHTLSRYMACACIYFGTYARDNDDIGAKAKPMGQGMSGGAFFAATAFALMPLALLVEVSHRGEFALALLPMALVTWRAFVYFKKWVGGYTGDCLGAVQQVTEVMFLACMVVLL
jgi:adenosylcobinamide-GDP ribazoletransferase